MRAIAVLRAYVLLPAILLLPSPMFASTGVATADEAVLSLPDAINIAGRQRMLSQRMVKLYCMLGLDVQPEVTRQQLDETRKLFERQLRQLQHIRGVDNDLSKDFLAKIRKHWEPIRQLLDRTPTPNRAHELRDSADEMLMAAHAFVRKLESISGNNQGRLVNIAGRQRMLSQRVAGYYMEKVWGVEDDHLQAEKTKAEEEFADALEFLKNSEENTREIKDLLALVEGQWHAFTAINKLPDPVYARPLMVSEASDRILELMDRITRLYAEL